MTTDTTKRSGLDELVGTLGRMRRGYMEQGKPDWLNDTSRLAEFSDSALLAVSEELADQWVQILIRARPPRQTILAMLEAAQAMEQDLSGILICPRRRRPARRVPAATRQVPRVRLLPTNLRKR